jgi:hypothetical protein
MNVLNHLIIAIIALFALLALGHVLAPQEGGLIISAAKAGYYRTECDWLDHCTKVWVATKKRAAHKKKRNRDYARRDRDWDREDGVAWEGEPIRGYRNMGYEQPRFVKCEDKVRGLGTQWIGTEGAMDAAKKDWMERVRYDYGESYLDMGNSKDFVSRCGRVSVGETMGQVLYRCEIVARPCKGLMEEGVATTTKK